MWTGTHRARVWKSGEAHLTEAEAVAGIGVGVSKHVRTLLVAGMIHRRTAGTGARRRGSHLGAREQLAGRPSCRAVGDGEPHPSIRSELILSFWRRRRSPVDVPAPPSRRDGMGLGFVLPARTGRSFSDRSNRY
jgi:hypothetical protein